MKATQVASLALGASILLESSSTGMLALGTGLTLFGAVGLVKNTDDDASTPSNPDDFEIDIAP